MRLRRVALVSAIAVGSVVASGSVGSGTGLAAAPETSAAAAPSVLPAPATQAVKHILVPAQLRPEIIAHRGDRADAVPNTPDAIASALAKGADAVEFDVVSTADGIPVIMHDPDLKRHTRNCVGPASAKTYREIRKCRGKDGKPVPNLDEMLREIPAGKRAYVHLKTPAGRGIAPRLMQAVNAYGQNSDGRVTFFSHFPKVLEELRAAGAASLGLIFYPENEARGWATDYDVLIPYRIPLTAAKVKAAHDRGQLVIPVEGFPTSAAKALALGVDGFMADDLPGVLARIG